MIEIIRAKLLLILATASLSEDKTVANQIQNLLDYIDVNVIEHSVHCECRSCV